MRAFRSVIHAALAVVLGLVVQSCAPASAPVITLDTSDGERVSLADYRGSKAVVLVFFTSWCEACAKQVEPIKEFVAEADPDHVAVLAVSIQEEADTIAKYIDKKELTYPVLLDGDGAAAAIFEVKGIPTIVGIDASGKIVFRGHSIPADLAHRLSNET
jgi:peroxiredoxin